LLIESLLLVFSRLIHSSPGGASSIVSFLASLGRIDVQEKQMVRVKANPHDKYASILKQQMVAAQVDALPFLLTKWVTFQREIHASYPTKVMLAALVKLVTFLYSNEGGAGLDGARAALRSLECTGYPIETPAAKGAAASKRQTRSATLASGQRPEPAFSKIPLPTKILSIVLAEWREHKAKADAKAKRVAKKLARATGQDDDDDDEDDDEDYDSDDDDDEFDDEDDSADDDDFIAKMVARERAVAQRGGGAAASSAASPFADASDFPDLGARRGGGGGGGGGKQLLQLSDMLDMHEAAELDEELEGEVYPEASSDPLNDLALEHFLQAFLRDFAATAQGAALQDAAKWLSPKDQTLLNLALASQPGAQTSPKKK
jgi:hypothetical protein